MHVRVCCQLKVEMFTRKPIMNFVIGVPSKI
ncbi:hypothetical protein BDFB_015204 [Asbolus verrucosus]|uniref:Uncharacterized protein n=1 Tax=Asbolus verrucosus TaxID=1661398 RepID=A0A482VCV1_ASBVE|nr:hypothetical protein BDFB_015204 [Asbolus verrucosus]